MDNFQDITMTEHVLESWKNVEKYKFSCIYMYVTIFAQWVRKRNFFIFLHPENMFLVNKMSTIRVRDPQTSIIWSFLHAWASGTGCWGSQGHLKVISLPFEVVLCYFSVPHTTMSPLERTIFQKIGRAHVWTPVTGESRMPSSAWT